MFQVGLYNLTACCYLCPLGMTTTKKGLDSQFKPSFTSKIFFYTTRKHCLQFHRARKFLQNCLVDRDAVDFLYLANISCQVVWLHGLPVLYSTPPCREHTLKGKNARIYSILRPNEFMDYAGGQGP